MCVYACAKEREATVDGRMDTWSISNLWNKNYKRNFFLSTWKSKVVLMNSERIDCGRKRRFRCAEIWYAWHAKQEWVIEIPVMTYPHIHTHTQTLYYKWSIGLQSIQIWVGICDKIRTILIHSGLNIFTCSVKFIAKKNHQTESFNIEFWVVRQITMKSVFA